MAVPDELPRLGAGSCKAEPVDDVVEARLEHSEQVLARDARFAARLVVVIRELLLEHAVIALGLLLLAQLEQVLALLDAAAAVLAGRIRAAFDVHFSVRQRSPLRNSFMPSRRHFLHLASVERAMPLPPRPAAACAGGSRCGLAG